MIIIDHTINKKLVYPIVASSSIRHIWGNDKQFDATSTTFAVIKSTPRDHRDAVLPVGPAQPTLLYFANTT